MTPTPSTSTSTISLTSGTTLSYQQAGEGDELVLFLHAVGGDARSWAPQMAAFAGRRYTCVALDCAGHGGSSANAGEPLEVGVSMVRFAADALELVARLGFSRAHLVGLSMGGVVALTAFGADPSRVQSLTLANTWAFNAEAAGRTAFMEGQLETMALPDSSAQLIPGLFGEGATPEMIAEAVTIEGSKDPAVFLQSWRDMFRPDLRPCLGDVAVPVLLIGGTRDEVTPADPLLTTIHAVVATSKLVEIDGAGHFSNLDHAARFNAELRGHLGRARGAGRLRARTPVLAELAADTTGQALVALLAQRGVDCLFANSGTDFTPIIDGLARYHGDADFGLETVLCPHENTTVSMAHGYFLVTGRAQAVMGHVGVGTANMGLGIINANRARVPVLVMAGRTPWYEAPPQTPTEGGRTNFVQWGQDCRDQGAMFREYCKWDYELKGPQALEVAVDRALAIASSDPAGPVYLTLPKEALHAGIPGGALRVDRHPRQVAVGGKTPGRDALVAAGRELLAAENPLVLTAELGRYRGGPEALVALAELLVLPVVEFGKRNFFNFPTEHPLHQGFGPSPRLEQADLVLVIEDPVPWIPVATELPGGRAPRTIALGVDPLFSAHPMSGFPVDLALGGDPAATLRALLEAVRELLASQDAAQEAARREALDARREALGAVHVATFQGARAAAAADASLEHISKRYISHCVGQAVDDDVLIFNEYPLDPEQVPRRLVDSWFENSIASGLGWSLGAALGAAKARPEQTMLVTVGDGSYLFNVPTSAHHVSAAHGLPIVVVVYNDQAWTTVKRSYLGTTREAWGPKKEHFPLTSFGVDMDLCKLVESVGGLGLRVETPAELPAALARALRVAREERRQVLVDVRCSP